MGRRRLRGPRPDDASRSRAATEDDKFADEDAETAEEVAAREAKARADGPGQRAAQRAREKAKAAVKTRVAYDDDALDDPVAEKARRQRLVEEADLRAAKRAVRRRGGEVGRVRTEE